VETPLLYPFATSEPYIDALSISQVDLQSNQSSAFLQTGSSNALFLQSSPEFCMKRLLSQTEVSIYQLCKAFRREQPSPRHLVEFTMLEWYMRGWHLEQLADQTRKLLKPLLGFEKMLWVSYSTIFFNLFKLNPHQATLDELRKLTEVQCNAVNVEGFSKDECLHLLFAEKIEKSLDAGVLTFIYDFPASQAALAKVKFNEDNAKVASRFEVFFGGMELANAYQEESSAEKLNDRFLEDNDIRKILGKEIIAVDEKLVRDVGSGFPECAGIALGVDRLLMLMLEKENIEEVVFFQREKN